MRACLAAVACVLGLVLALPAASSADEVIGSPLSGEPTVKKVSPVDSVYWLQTLPDGTSAAVKAAGTVRSVTIKGYAKSKEALLQTILIQVLRPQPGGKLLVVETSQAFKLSTEPGTYTFEPTNMTVQPGDFIGIATLGGEFMFATSAAGALTNDFSGHEKDMNGDEVTPTTPEPGVELLLKVDIKEKAQEEKELIEKEQGLKIEQENKKKEEELKNKPCECQLMEIFIDHTLLKKRRVPSSKRTFGVGFDWHMTCTKGKGGCTSVLKFSPPEIFVGRHRREKSLKLGLEALTFECKTLCNTSTFGRFEIRMKSRRQLNDLFGRTLAFRIETLCSGIRLRYFVEVFVDRSGRMHAGALHTLRL